MYLRSTDNEKFAIDLAENPASMFFANEVNSIDRVLITRDIAGVGFPVNVEFEIKNSNIWPPLS